MAGQEGAVDRPVARGVVVKKVQLVLYHLFRADPETFLLA
jgi:hypothetical protein